MIVTVNRARTTYKLEVEKGGKRSDYSCDCKGTKDDALPGDGEERQEVRSQL